MICTKWLALLLALAASSASAQGTSERIFRLGHLTVSQSGVDATHKFTLPELAKLGFTEGRNVIVIDRFGDDAEMPRLVRELLDAKVDALLTIGPGALLAASAATRTVPIIGFGTDPTQIGLAASLARPGGNVTGVVILGAELDAKRFDLLRVAVPAARRFAALVSSLSPQRDEAVSGLRKRASDAGVSIQIVYASGPGDYPHAFASMQAGRAQALVIAANATFQRDGAQLAALAMQKHLPTVCEWADMAEVGCLLGYGPDRADLRRRLAYFIARIFRGAAAAELPVETPTRFELAINVKVARALGIAIPAELEARADILIE